MSHPRWGVIFAVAACALAARPTAADGRFGPAGLEFGLGPSNGPVSLASQATGGRFLAAWNRSGEVWGRLFDFPGVPRGPEFRVTPPEGPFYDVYVAAGPGRFVVLYDRDGTGLASRLDFAVYDADGLLLARGQVTDAAQYGGSVAVSASGSFMVAWNASTGGQSRIDARLYDADGAPLGGAFTLATSGADVLLRPDGASGYFAHWQAGEGYFGRRFDAQGAPAGLAIGLQGRARSCPHPAGGFAAAWQGDSAAPHGPYPLWLQRYGADDTPLGAATRLDTDAPSSGGRPKLACAGDGAFVAAWSSAPDGTSSEIFARRFDAQGAADGRAFRVNEATAGGQDSAAVTGGAGGDFVVAWRDESPPPQSGPRLLARAFTLAPPPAKGDFDRDGHADLVLRRVSDGQVRVWTMRETVRQANLVVSPQTPDWAWHVGGVDDFDGDADADLLLRHQATGAIDVWLLGGVSGVERVGQATITGAVLPPPEWIVAATGDFDGDRRPDLLWRNLVTNKLAVWLLDGTAWRATLFPSPDQAADSNWKVVGTGDFDGDGRTDLLWYNVSSGRAVQWLLDQNLARRVGRFTTPMAAGDANWNVVAAADYGFGLRGQAGTPDLVWRNDSSGKLVAWHLDTAGVRSAGVFTTPDAPSEPLGFTVVGPR